MIIFENIPLRDTEAEYAHFVSSFDALRAPRSDFLSRLSACFALIVSSPLLLFIACILACDTKGPLLFKQQRVGFQGKVFVIYKFRTMYIESCHARGGSQALKGDSRVTRTGRWLRRSGLDELPQLWNVMRGEMALVGPRPHAVEHDLYFSQHIADYWHRYSVRPGLTGLAQIKGCRGATPTIASMQERVTHDIDYVRSANVYADLKILLKTAKAIFCPPSLLH